MAALVAGQHSEAGLVQRRRHVLITTAVLTQAVHQAHHGARLAGRLPGTANEL